MTGPTGMPIWYELLTPDVDAAKEFYGEIVGWNFSEFPSPDGGMKYAIANVGETGVAGVSSGPPGNPFSPIWLVYFRVADVDAKSAENEKAGGKTHMPATDLPSVGRIALVEDPQGILFYLMKPDPGMGNQVSTSFSETLPGRCGWNELVTTDHKKALAHYGDLFGWVSSEAMQMGAMGDYSFIDCGDRRIGAMMDKPYPEPGKWGFYFNVRDVDAAADKVKAGGGQIVMGPVDVPGGQRVIAAIDPQGAAIGFVSRRM